MITKYQVDYSPNLQSLEMISNGAQTIFVRVKPHFPDHPLAKVM